jgi:hypothetical protein
MTEIVKTFEETKEYIEWQEKTMKIDYPPEEEEGSWEEGYLAGMQDLLKYVTGQLHGDEEIMQAEKEVAND